MHRYIDHFFEYVIIEERLIIFRDCSFLLVYMLHKPARYRLKTMCLCDANSSCFYNGYMYSGKDSDGKCLSDDEKKLLVPSQSVFQLS